MKNIIVIFCIFLCSIINLGCPQKNYPLLFKQNNSKDKLRLKIMDNKIDLRIQGNGFRSSGGSRYSISLNVRINYKDLLGKVDFHIDEIVILLDDSLTMSKLKSEGEDGFFPKVTDNSYLNYFKYYVYIDDSLSYKYDKGAEFKLWLGEFITIDGVPIHIGTIIIWDPCTWNCYEDND